jgi:hypothetical protein
MPNDAASLPAIAARSATGASSSSATFQNSSPEAGSRSISTMPSDGVDVMPTQKSAYVKPRASTKPSGSPCPLTFFSISSYSSTSAIAAGSDFSAVDDPACARRTRTPATRFSVFFCRLPLIPPKTFGFSDADCSNSDHEPRFELIGNEFLRRPDVQDRRRPVVETFADDVEERFRLRHLRGEGAPERDVVIRDVRITRPGLAGFRSVNPVLGAPFIRRLRLRRPERRRGRSVYRPASLRSAAGFGRLRHSDARRSLRAAPDRASKRPQRP